MASLVLCQQASQNWMRLSVTNQVCVKGALLDILHDPTIGVSKNKQKFCTLLFTFKAQEERNLRGVIKPFQWQILCHFCDANCSTPCPKSGQTDSNDLDITCIIVLIIHLTKLPPPLGRNGWRQTLPQQGDVSVAASVLLARDLRNFLSHCSFLQLQTRVDFDREWKRMENVLSGLGYKNKKLFHELEHASLDPYHEQQVEALKDVVTDLSNVQIPYLKFLYNEVDKKIDATNTLLKRELDKIKVMIDDFDKRITKNEENIKKQDQRFNHCDDHLRQHDQQFERLESRLESRLEQVEEGIQSQKMSVEKGK